MRPISERFDREVRSDGASRRLIRLFQVFAAGEITSDELLELRRIVDATLAGLDILECTPKGASVIMRRIPTAVLDPSCASLRGSGSLVGPLSRMEREILSLIDLGLTNGQIAEQLRITVGTTKWYVSQVISKMQVRTRVQASRRAWQLGLL